MTKATNSRERGERRSVLRLQHYVELCYIVVGLLAIRDVVYLCRHPREIRRLVTPLSLAQGVVMLAVAPVTLAVFAYRFLRNN
jgi:hypothetical protein